MSLVKSQGRTNDMMQKAETGKNGNQPQNMTQSGSKVSPPPCKVSNGKHKCKERSSTLEDGKSNRMKCHRRNITGQREKITEPKGPQKRRTNKPGNGTPKNVRYAKDGEGTGGMQRTDKLKLLPKTHPTIRERINNKIHEKVTESEEEESESSSGSSAEVTGVEISNDEKEEQGSDKEPSEMQRSEESSEEETEASNTQRDTEQTANKDSDKELSEETQSRSDSEVKSVESGKEEQENKKEVEVSEAGGEDKEITQKDTGERPTAAKACRCRRRSPRPSKESKCKMFKKTKAEKQAEKAEKQRAKAEKQRLEKEAKQKAKEEKKNKKKPLKENKPSSATEVILLPKGISRNKVRTRKGAIQLVNKTKIIHEKDAPVEADTTDLDEEEDEPTLTKAIKGQNQIMLLKAKGKDFKAILEPEKHRDTGSVVKGRPQSLLLGKVKMASLRRKTNKIVAKPDEVTSEGETLDGGSGKLKERLIARRKGTSSLHRVSGWIQQNVPQGLNLRKKLSAWTKAIGVSHWLSFRAIKQKKGPKKSKGCILKHRMAMRVASKTSLAIKKNGSSNENEMAKEDACQTGKAREGGEGAVPDGEKDTEAKYAVVLPRMNKLGKEETAGEPQAASGSTPSSTTGSGEPITSESKPPKPGARLVLPVKPDLTLLKTIKKPLAAGLTSGGDLREGSPGSSGTQEASFSTEDRNRRAALENQDEVSVLQAARRKVDPSKINLTKMSLPKETTGPTQANGADPGSKAAVGIPRSTTLPYQSGEAATGMSHVQSLYEEEADREVAQLMGEGGIYTIAHPEVHWAGNPRMSGDPQVCVIFFVVIQSL